MSSVNDGGPAFPVRDFWDPDESRRHEPGMTLRDYLASRALTGIIAKSPYKSGTLAEMKASGDIEARVAAAYDYADAMIAYRNK